MTEKRFTLEQHINEDDILSSYALIIDNDTSETYSNSMGSLKEIVECLNTLHEENQQQKKIIQELKDIIYSDEDQIIGEWSGNIGEDMEKLNKAYESDDINDLIKFCNGEC